MSEKLTRIKLPGQKLFSGIMEWGEKDASEMLNSARRYSEALRAEADAIDSAADDEFQIDVVRGPRVQHRVRELQSSTRAR